MLTPNERDELELRITKYRSRARRVMREESVARLNRLIAELEKRLRQIDV